MADYVDINLEEVDLSYKMPPPGEYKAAIDNYEFVTNADGSLKWIAFAFILLEGIEAGIGMTVKDNQDPNKDIGKKKMKMMALACHVPFSNQRIDLEPFLGQQLGVKIVHKPGKDKETMFANISKFFELAPPIPTTATTGPTNPAPLA
jgi:hypothetical protein